MLTWEINGIPHNGDAIAGWPVTTPGSTIISDSGSWLCDIDGDLE